MCPEYRDMAEGVKKIGYPLHRCMMQPNNYLLDDVAVERTCRNNYQTCYIYQRKYRKPQPQVPQNNTKSSSSGSGIFTLIVLGVVIFFGGKFLGLW